jgi:NADPH:quinone reductase-like Zn-dependent oxidoreductase/ubiquinone/menaquinone biosynthesis C-methylase UbiE
MVIALEAARQTIDTKPRPISAFLLKDAEFIAPVMIGQTPQDATEIVIELRPIEDMHDKDSIESEVQIYSYHDDNWRLCFRVNVQLEYEAVQNLESSWADETSWERTKMKEQLHSTATSCTQPIDQHTFYQYCEKQGLKYGPSFQLLDNIQWDGDDTSMARIDMTSTGRILKDADSPVHPAILDAMVHLMFAQVSKGTARLMPMAVPHRIAKARISARPWNRVTSSVQLRSTKDTIPGSLTSFTGNIQAVGDEGFPLCTIETLQMTEVSRVEEAEDDGPSRTLLHQIAWKPQLSSLSPVELQKLCNLDSPLDNSAFRETFFPKIELAMRASIRQALQEITQEDVDRAPEYLKKFAAYLKHQYSMEMFPEDPDLHGSALEALLTECLSENPKWQLFPRAARALSSIIRGETNALEVLFNDHGAEDYYSEIFGFFSQDKRVSKFLDLLTHEKPGLKILEIGSGTGSMTGIILKAIEAFEKETGQTRLAEFTYTDISPSFFEAAREKFAYFEDRMVFKTFNVDIDPMQQGFQEAHYDVVVAGSVLHVTQDLAAGLTKLHRLLKPQGHLMLLEITNLHSACNTVGFGPLEGWWQASEEWRQYGPLATEQRWDELMRDVGFSGVDLSLYDGYMTNLMISTSLGTPKTNGMSNGVSNGVSNGLSNGVSNGMPNGVSNHGQTDILLLIDDDSDTHCALATEIKRRHQHVQVINLADVEKLSERLSSSKIVVSLLECSAPRLATINEADFYALQTHIQGVRNLLWVSGNSSATDPHFSLSTGLLRCLRSEQASKHIVSLSIESCPPGTDAEFISRLLNSCFLDETTSEELEFVVRHGHLNIGRLRENADLETERKSRMAPRLISQAWESGPPLVLEAGIPGIINTLRFVEDPAASDLAPTEVEIKASVWPISSRDISIVLGRMENAGLGLECAGTISRVGSACSDRFTPGERVLMVHPGTMRSLPRAPADAVFKLPETLSLNDAVAGMVPGMTAWYALVHVGRLQRGEKVLVHDAADGTGQTAIKIATKLGAEIFATVDSEEKRKLVIGLGIPESHVFYSRDASFVKGVKRVTNDYGVDVVLNSLTGQGLRASWGCIAPYGRFVNLGKLDVTIPGFANNASFAVVDLQHIILKNSALLRQLVESALSLIADPAVGGPVPLHFFPISQIGKAFRSKEAGENTGRTLVTIEPTDVVSVRLNVPCSASVEIMADCGKKFLVRKSTRLFQADASYLVVGGLGGLGRAILRWMVDQGARNLVVPSRSGPSSQAAFKIVSELSSQGVSIITPRCNVSSSEELSALLQNCTHMAPIRGCINLAMVLQVGGPCTFD